MAIRTSIVCCLATKTDMNNLMAWGGNGCGNGLPRQQTTYYLQSPDGTPWDKVFSFYLGKYMYENYKILPLEGGGWEGNSKFCWLSFGLQHGEVEVDELQVAGWGGVVAATQLCVEYLAHVADTCVDLHTHLRYGFLGRVEKDRKCQTVKSPLRATVWISCATNVHWWHTCYLNKVFCLSY